MLKSEVMRMCIDIATPIASNVIAEAIAAAENARIQRSNKLIQLFFGTPRTVDSLREKVAKIVGYCKIWNKRVSPNRYITHFYTPIGALVAASWRYGKHVYTDELILPVDTVFRWAKPL